MIADLYAQITPDNHDQILEHVASLEPYTPEQDYALFRIGRYINIFILEDRRTYWTVFDTFSHKRTCTSFDELLTQLFIIQLEN